MKYKCANCNKDFSQKCNYTVHINRKYPCIKDTYMQQVPITVTQQVPINVTQQVTTNMPSIHIYNQLNNVSEQLPPINIIIQNKNQCKFCFKTFVRKDVLNKHLNGRCKSKINVLEEGKQEIIDRLEREKQEIINRLEGEKQKLLKQLKEQKNINKKLLEENKKMHENVLENIKGITIHNTINN